MLWREPGPLAMHLLGVLERAANDKHGASMTVIGATGAVLPDGATKLRHGQDHHVAHAIAKVSNQRRNAFGEIAKPLC